MQLTNEELQQAIDRTWVMWHYCKNAGYETEKYQEHLNILIEEQQIRCSNVEH